ncbi:hypothetical protein E2C01_069028 [Portunus trituberculatus]|uniref:Uncharacterized protein n=1 Tax=Portunus trituberculatus TaxID=210409 RepID=A0A5B7I136_PORTR|nr:hypothetical protein [Portunus trituberculatus]
MEGGLCKAEKEKEKLKDLVNKEERRKFLVVSLFWMETVVSVLESMGSDTISPCAVTWISWSQPTLQWCMGTIRAVLQLCAQLGIQINLPKSDLVPRVPGRGAIFSEASGFSIARSQLVFVGGAEFSRGQSPKVYTAPRQSSSDTHKGRENLRRGEKRREEGGSTRPSVNLMGMGVDC